MSSKALSKRLKAAGLQKLKWYCEMCQKQCRDQNGFKCHQTSEGHLKQMAIFAQDPERLLREYSQQFEAGFMAILGRHRKRILANAVYQEYISDHHVHMNATRWDTLSSFVQYLGRSGKVHVEDTERGWFLQTIEPRVVKKVVDIDHVAKRARQTEVGPEATARLGAMASFSFKKGRTSWLVPGIIVKFKKKKGVVTKLVSPGVGEIAFEDEVREVDQDDLETVIPAPGKLVRILNGRWKGQSAVVLGIDEASFSVSLRLSETGDVLANVEYHDISKLV